MSSYNRIILVGSLGRDAELRVTPQGKQVATFSMAVEDWQKKDAAGKPLPEWYKGKLWGRQAETLAPYLTKGKTILVDGRLSIQTWVDRDGKNRYTPEVSADKVVLLGGGQRDGDAGGSRGGLRPMPQSQPFDDDPGDVTDSDIPFAWLLPLVLPAVGLLGGMLMG